MRYINLRFTYLLTYLQRVAACIYLNHALSVACDLRKLASCFKRTYSEETDELVKVRFIRSINRTPAHARVPSTQHRQLSKVVVPC